MGFVVGRDMISGLNNEPIKTIPRELCDGCGFFALFYPRPFFKLIECTQPQAVSS